MRHGRNQRGVALSSPLALLSAGVVLVAGAAFVFTGDRDWQLAARNVVKCQKNGESSRTGSTWYGCSAHHSWIKSCVTRIAWFTTF